MIPFTPTLTPTSVPVVMPDIPAEDDCLTNELLVVLDILDAKVLLEAIKSNLDVICVATFPPTKPLRTPPPAETNAFVGDTSWFFSKSETTDP